MKQYTDFSANFIEWMNFSKPENLDYLEKNSNGIDKADKVGMVMKSILDNNLIRIMVELDDETFQFLIVAFSLAMHELDEYKHLKVK